MMLYQCPDCKGKVSSDAVSCPHCGKPIAAVIAADVGMKVSETEKESENKSPAAMKKVKAVFQKKKWLLPAIIGAAAVIITLVLILTSTARKARQESFMKVGNYVTFGAYPQTAEGMDSTPIEWMVLDYDAKSNRSLLVSRYGLDVQPYNTDDGEMTWEECTLRAWLNDVFLKSAFSKSEQEAILTSYVDNGESQSEYRTDGGSNTRDKVFLLSYAEAEKYINIGEHFGENRKEVLLNRRIAPTAYALARGANTSPEYKTAEGKEAARWWLRSFDRFTTSAGIVLPDGEFNGRRLDILDTLVRPAFWLDLSAL